jgi:hypothetical protein
VTNGHRLILRYNIEHAAAGPIYSLPSKAASDNRLQNLLSSWTGQNGENEYELIGIVLDETFDDRELLLGPQFRKGDATIVKQLRRICEAKDVYMCFANMRRITKQMSDLYSMRSRTRRHMAFTCYMDDTPKDTVEIMVRNFVESNGQPHPFGSLQRSFDDEDFLDHCYFDNMNPNEEPDEEWEDRYTRTYERTVRYLASMVASITDACTDDSNDAKTRQDTILHRGGRHRLSFGYIAAI